MDQINSYYASLNGCTSQSGIIPVLPQYAENFRLPFLEEKFPKIFTEFYHADVN